MRTTSIKDAQEATEVAQEMLEDARQIASYWELSQSNHLTHLRLLKGSQLGGLTQISPMRVQSSQHFQWNDLTHPNSLLMVSQSAGLTQISPIKVRILQTDQHSNSQWNDLTLLNWLLKVSQSACLTQSSPTVVTICKTISMPFLSDIVYLI